MRERVKVNFKVYKGKGLTSKTLSALLDASYKKKHETPSQVQGYNYDSHLSTDTSKVFVNPKTGHAVVAHRGTQGVSDWANNAMYAATGRRGYQTTKRFKDAQKVHQAAEAKYGAHNISSIGHSQGALLARMLGEHNKEVLAVNPAYNPLSNNEHIKSNEHILRHPNDAVSIGLKNNKQVQSFKTPTKSINPLDVHSYKQLGQEDAYYGDPSIGEIAGSGFEHHFHHHMKGGASALQKGLAAEYRNQLVVPYDKQLMSNIIHSGDTYGDYAPKLRANGDYETHQNGIEYRQINPHDPDSAEEIDPYSLVWKKENENNPHSREQVNPEYDPTNSYRDKVQRDLEDAYKKIRPGNQRVPNHLENYKIDTESVRKNQVQPYTMLYNARVQLERDYQTFKNTDLPQAIREVTRYIHDGDQLRPKYAENTKSRLFDLLSNMQQQADLYNANLARLSAFVNTKSLQTIVTVPTLHEVEESVNGKEILQQQQMYVMERLFKLERLKKSIEDEQTLHKNNPNHPKLDSTECDREFNNYKASLQSSIKYYNSIAERLEYIFGENISKLTDQIIKDNKDQWLHEYIQQHPAESTRVKLKYKESSSSSYKRARHGHGLPLSQCKKTIARNPLTNPKGSRLLKQGYKLNRHGKKTKIF